MGYFVSVLRERIANFEDPKGGGLIAEEELADGQAAAAVELSEGVSINDLRKNLPLLNEYMEEQCRSTAGRYGIELDAALITEIDPPPEVDRALSAINSTRNQAMRRVRRCFLRCATCSCAISLAPFLVRFAGTKDRCFSLPAARGGE